MARAILEAMTKRKTGCPVLRFEASGSRVDAYEGDALVGRLELREHGEGLKITRARIEAKLKRCGLGTKLYDRAVSLATEQGKRIVSDSARTPSNDAFWRRMQKRGRAECIDSSGGTKITTRKGSGFEEAEKGGYTCKRYALTPKVDRRKKAAKAKPVELAED